MFYRKETEQVLWITLCILTNGTRIINDFAQARLYQHTILENHGILDKWTTIKFPMVCTLIDHRNDINIFKTMQCSTCVWNILMLHVFLWLIRVQTMEMFFTITLTVLTSISIEVSRKVEKRSVTSCYHGSTISGWQQNQWRWQWQEERQKIGLY